MERYSGGSGGSGGAGLRQPRIRHHRRAGSPRRPAGNLPAHLALRLRATVIRLCGSPLPGCSPAVPLKRLEVFDQIVFFRLGEPEVKTVVVAVDHIQQRGETPVVIKAALVRGSHEEAAFAHEDSCEIHRAVGMPRGTIRFEAIDLHLFGGMLIPAGFGPQWLAVTTIAVCLS